MSDEIVGLKKLRVLQEWLENQGIEDNDILYFKIRKVEGSPLKWLQTELGKCPDKSRMMHKGELIYICDRETGCGGISCEECDHLQEEE